MAISTSSFLKVIGRYALYGPIAKGGQASVHLGRLIGPVGFSRTVAIKRLHAQYANDPKFVAMLLDEARLAARIRHPNVAQIIDALAVDDELFLVMDYIEGDTLAGMLSTAGWETARLGILSRILVDALEGLHAAHEARDERGESLEIVHRDVSPDNLLVGTDGLTRVLDFGIASAAGRLHETRTGEVKGKAAYMPPEQMRSQGVDRRTDVYAISVVLWQALVGRRPFAADSDAALLYQVLEARVPPPSELVPGLAPELDALVLRGLSRDRAERFPTALAMAEELRRVVPPAASHEVAQWVRRVASARLEARAKAVRAVESDTTAVERMSVGPDRAQRASAPDAHEIGASAVSNPASKTGEPTSPARGVRQRRAFWLVGAVGIGTAALAAWSVVTLSRAPEADAQGVGSPAVASPSPQAGSSRTAAGGPRAGTTGTTGATGGPTVEPAPSAARSAAPSAGPSAQAPSAPRPKPAPITRRPPGLDDLYQRQ